jgi:hypothetical protein
VIEFSIYLTHQCIRLIQPVLSPLCFVVAWLLILGAFWSVGSALRDGIAKAKRMHQIPCANCRFFTNRYQLKCPVHPSIALSEEAIGCTDFEPDSSSGYPRQSVS